MSIQSRDVILQTLRGELSKGPQVARPAAVEVWPCENPSLDAMAQRFQAELAEVHGEVILAATVEEARGRLVRLGAEAGWTSWGAMDRPAVREIAADLPPDAIHWAVDDWPPRAIAQFSVGLVEPEVLLADTGSCLIACSKPQDRLLCYLPPACVVVARMDQLAEHMPAAWASIAPRVADPSQRGEFVIVTGPSRTADIEKILILGVHGPKRLVVVLIG